MRNRAVRCLAGLIFCGLFAFLWACPAKPLLYYDMPRKVKVRIEGGINVRLKPGTQATQSAVVGVARGGETFKVLDARPAYYRIILPDSRKGWISANPDENWTTRIDENLVKVNKEGGLSVRQEPYDGDSPQLGIAVKDFVFEMVDTEYSHVKILLANGRKGWMFIGRPSKRLVEESYLP